MTQWCDDDNDDETTQWCDDDNDDEMTQRCDDDNDDGTTHHGVTMIMDDEMTQWCDDGMKPVARRARTGKVKEDRT